MKFCISESTIISVLKKAEIKCIFLIKQTKIKLYCYPTGLPKTSPQTVSKKLSKFSDFLAVLKHLFVWESSHLYIFCKTFIFILSASANFLSNLEI